MNDALSLIFRWLHIIPALLMVGGIFFMRFCLPPRTADEGSLFDAQDGARKRWMKIVMISTTLLLVSGLYNTAIKAMSFQMAGTSYNALLGVKILLALAVFYLTAVLAGRSERAKKFRQRETYWLNVVLVLMLLIVMIAGYMKISSTNFPKKVRGEQKAVAWALLPATEKFGVLKAFQLSNFFYRSNIW